MTFGIIVERWPGVCAVAILQRNVKVLHTLKVYNPLICEPFFHVTLERLHDNLHALYKYMPYTNYRQQLGDQNHMHFMVSFLKNTELIILNFTWSHNQ